MKLKEKLWRIGLIPDKWFKCPKCGSKIMKTGYREMSIQHYKCSNCDWGRE